MLESCHVSKPVKYKNICITSFFFKDKTNYLAELMITVGRYKCVL